MAKRPAIFLDRDDTLNLDEGYTQKISDFGWIKGAPEALRLFKNAGLDVYIVTNQGGIGRGIFTQEQMQNFNDHLCAEAIKIGGVIKDVAWCPHHPLAVDPALAGPCDHRKPGPGMILGLAKKWDIDLGSSVMIGDRDTDVAAGRAAGCHAYLFDGTDLETLARHVLTTHFPNNVISSQ
ncbi:HAD family hydrolase [Alphaproteobacteria bacterium]|nr:HAD family hydrolase [Alphaproteobacteria bacterium]